MIRIRTTTHQTRMESTKKVIKKAVLRHRKNVFAVGNQVADLKIATLATTYRGMSGLTDLERSILPKPNETSRRKTGKIIIVVVAGRMVEDGR